MELKPIAYDAGDGIIIQQTGQVFLMSGRDAWEVAFPDHLPDLCLGLYGSAEDALAALQKVRNEHPFLFGQEAGCSMARDRVIRCKQGGDW
jgi:hypothetical protein